MKMKQTYVRHCEAEGRSNLLAAGLLRRHFVPPRNDCGFTLIELLVVIVILGILASLAVPRLAGRTEEARVEAAKADLEGGIALALDLFEVDTGKYPASLEELVKKPSEAARWKGPYLKRGLPKDPWGSLYVYRFPGSRNSHGYDLFSLGPDQKEGTGDEIANGVSPY